MIRGLLALRLHFRIIGRVPPNDVKVQTQSKKTFNHELGAQGGGGGGGIWEKIDGGFGRDNRDEYCSVQLYCTVPATSTVCAREPRRFAKPVQMSCRKPVARFCNLSTSLLSLEWGYPAVAPCGTAL